MFHFLTIYQNTLAYPLHSKTRLLLDLTELKKNLRKKSERFIIYLAPQSHF
jgi:hypothetical protein